MARAYFNCHECGETVEVYASTRKEADRLADYRTRNESLCHDCWSKQRDAQRVEASQQAAETAALTGLPVLQGTEKQVTWAETIRANKLQQIDALVAGFAEQDVGAEERAIVLEAMAAIRAVDSAHWWIENRTADFFSNSYDFSVWLVGGSRYLKLTQPEILARARQHFGGLPRPEPVEIAPPEIVADVRAESTVRPPHTITETVAEITAHANRVTVVFPEKREDFRTLVKNLGYQWSGLTWERALNPTHGDPADRASEVGHRLLSAGFPVLAMDTNIRARMVSGAFEPECTRWVQQHSSGTEFFIRWGRDEDFYQVARRLPRSAYVKPGVTVPSEFFDEVLDFAAAYGFRLSGKALDLVEQARANRDAALVAQPAPKPKRAPARADTRIPALDIPAVTDIDPDLQD